MKREDFDEAGYRRVSLGRDLRDCGRDRDALGRADGPRGLVRLSVGGGGGRVDPAEVAYPFALLGLALVWLIFAAVVASSGWARVVREAHVDGVSAEQTIGTAPERAVNEKPLIVTHSRRGKRFTKMGSK